MKPGKRWWGLGREGC